MKIEKLYELFLDSSGICTDTRKIQANCIFFALKGDNFNGNEFAQEALEKGAMKVVIDQINAHKNSGETILCSNSLKKLQQLATYHRNQLDLPIIALTGSNGKTTTKELISAVLAQQFKITATKGNLNNHIGVPLTLLSMDENTEIGIVEMGANHLKEIEGLCEIAQPNYGYITNFGKAHIEGFGSLEGVVQGKTEMYRHLASHGMTVFINQNDAKQVTHSKGMNTVYFGGDQSDPIELVTASPTLTIKYRSQLIPSHLIGIYNFSNISAAIAIGDFFGVEPSKIKKGIETYIPQNNRSQLLKKGEHQIILDAYNANPSSMLAALQNFFSQDNSSKVLILGDMFELGQTAEAEHQAIHDYIENHFEGTTYLIGSNFHRVKSENEQIQKFESFERFKEFFGSQSLPPSHLLIKGSRGMALERVLDLL